MLNESLLSNKETTEEKIELTKKEDVNAKFTKYSPFVTLLMMSIGPFSLTLRAFLDIVETTFITKGFKKRDPSIISIIGYAAVPMQIMPFFPMFFGQAIAARVSLLIGSGKYDLAKQVVVDIYRISLSVCFIVVCIFYFTEKYLLDFSGCPSNLFDKTFEFTLYQMFFIPCLSLSYASSYYLQSIGRSDLSAVLQMLGSIFQSLILAPILIYLIKIKSTYMRLSYSLSLSTIGIIFTILIFKGKFSLKIHPKLLLNSVVKETGKAIIYALPYLLQFISLIIPPIFILNAVTNVDKSKSSMIGGAHACYSKLFVLLINVPGALSISFLSVGSHSFGNKDYNKFFRYFRLTVLTCFVALGILIGIVFIFTKQITSLFINDKDALSFTIKYVRIPFYSFITESFIYPVGMFLLIIGKPYYSMIVSAIQTIILSVGSKMIGKRTKDVHDVVYIYNISDVTITIIYLIIFIISLIQLKKKIKKEEIRLNSSEARTEEMDVSLG